MAREKEDYRPILEDILSYPEGRRLLSVKDVAGYLGICEKTAKARYGITKEGITAPALARRLA